MYLSPMCNSSLAYLSYCPNIMAKDLSLLWYLVWRQCCNQLPFVLLAIINISNNSVLNLFYSHTKTRLSTPSAWRRVWFVGLEATKSNLIQYVIATKSFLRKIINTVHQVIDGETTFGISGILFHPQFDSHSGGHDVAIITLKSRVNLTNTILPICLPPESDNQHGKYCGAKKPLAIF